MSLFTFGRAYHLMNNVNACDALGDWMLDLQPSVHLQKVKLALAVDQKLHRAYTNYTDITHTRHKATVSQQTEYNPQISTV